MTTNKPDVQGEPVFMWHRGATDDESEVVDVDCACPCCVPLYTAPQPAAMPPEIPRELLGTIIDEVFDGAVEDVGVIEDIYRAIARRFVEKPAEQQPSVQKPVGFVSQDFLEGKWSLDHIAKSDEGQISRTIPVFAKPPQPAEQKPSTDLGALVEALTMARETIAAALRANAPDYFTTDADIARHVAIQSIDAAMAALRKKGGDV